MGRHDMRKIDDDELFDIQALMTKVGLTVNDIEQAFKKGSYDNLDEILNKQRKEILVHIAAQFFAYSACIEEHMTTSAKAMDSAERLIATSKEMINNQKKFAELQKNIEQLKKSIQAKSGGIAKHKNDPKQAAKADVKVFYVKWQSHGNPKSMYRSAAAFATAMMDKFNDPNNEKPTLESQTVITRWCTQWKKELNNSHPA